MRRRQPARVNMSSSPFFFASFALMPLLNWWQTLDETRRREMTIGFAAVGFMTVVLVILLISLSRESGRHHHHNHHRHSHDEETDEAVEVTGDNGDGSSHGRRRKWRRRRRPHRPRNPTLAETGGLPPLRSQPPPQNRP